MKKLLLIYFAFLCACNSPTKTEQEQAQILVKNYLDSTLNDPKSYEAIAFGKIHTLKDTINVFDGRTDSVKWNGTKSIMHKYRAKNSLGGYVVKDVFFHTDSALLSVKCCFIK